MIFARICPRKMHFFILFRGQLAKHAREIDGFFAYFAGDFALCRLYLERYKQIGKAA